MSFKASGPLLIFCLNDLSVDINEVLKSPTRTMLLSISTFMSLNMCFIYLVVPMSGAYMFTNAISYSCIGPLIILWCPSLTLVTVFVLKSVLSEVSVATPVVILFLFVWDCFSSPHFQSVCVFRLEMNFFKAAYMWILFLSIQPLCNF